jgi:signal transduction histidine kinase
MSITPPIRHRLLTVVFLGVITSGLSLVALVRMLSTATVQRIERGRDNVDDEAERLAAVGASPPEARRSVLFETPRSQSLGMRGGYVDRTSVREAAMPQAWHATVDAAVDRAARTGAPVVSEGPLPDGTLVVSVHPTGDGTLAWAANPVRSPPYLDNWRWIVVALSLVTLLLVVTAVHAVITLRSSAAALNASLVSLAQDLSAPVPRPPVRELSDIADGIAVLAHSLRQARDTEERLGQELAQQQRLAALGRVVAGVAHEVRNPLASIKLRLDLAVAGSAGLPAPVEQAVSHASSEIARLDRLVADLLLVAGRSLGPQRRTPLGALVRDRVAALAPWAQLRRVEVAVEVEGPADVVLAIDPDSVSRAFDNLLRNAVEASPAGGTVRVGVGYGPGQGEAQGARIRVEDRGAGVAGSREAELFEPFFTTKADGTGLGLAISRAIARAHGGDVVYTREGAVTRFELTLPRRAPRAEALREATG